MDRDNLPIIEGCLLVSKTFLFDTSGRRIPIVQIQMGRGISPLMHLIAEKAQKGQPYPSGSKSSMKRFRPTLKKGNIPLPNDKGSGSSATHFTFAQGASSSETSSPGAAFLIHQPAFFPASPQSCRNVSASSSKLKTGKHLPSPSVSTVSTSNPLA